MPEWTVPGFTRLRELGSGGFGEVVLARHEASGTLVAIKYLRQSLLSDPEFSELFRHEAAVLASLDDPNVVRLYEYVESPSGAAIVMELIDGVSLRQILTHQGATTADAALVILMGSLLGLAAAHQHGGIRDVHGRRGSPSSVACQAPEASQASQASPRGGRRRGGARGPGGRHRSGRHQPAQDQAQRASSRGCGALRHPPAAILAVFVAVVLGETAV